MDETVKLARFFNKTPILQEINTKDLQLASPIKILFMAAKLMYVDGAGKRKAD